MPKFYVIGVGSGAGEYLLPAARRRIESADCLIGGRRVLALFPEFAGERFCPQGDFGQVISYIRRHKKEKKIAVVVSGDPGFYSLLGKISRVFPQAEYEVIPGISALQLAFARLGRPWQDVRFISLHGRSRDDLAGEIGTGKEVFLLTDNSFPPQQIARFLLQQGAGNRPAVVLENLGYPQERIARADLEAIATMDNFGLCVMVIEQRVATP